MLDYHDLLKDREKLAAQLDRQARLLAEMENSTAIRLAHKLQPLTTFLRKLRNLGRAAVAPMAETAAYPALSDHDRPALILLLHEAGGDDNSRLGLALVQHFAATHQVIVVLAAGGEALAQFKNIAAQVIGPLGFSVHEPAESRRVAAALAAAYQPVFGVAIGADTRYLAAPLAQAGVPVVAVITEFAANVVPYGSLLELFFWASDLVFPAALIRESYLADYPMLGAKRTHLLPYSEIGDQRSEIRLDHNLNSAPSFTVTGLGPIEWRQGVDVFVAVAQACRTQSPHTPWRFIWRSDGYVLGHGNDLSTYLNEQIERAGLQDIVSIERAGEQPADLMLLSARLAALPQNIVQAMAGSMPVIAFGQASALAEIMLADPVLREAVVPYLDVGAAAAIICRLAQDATARTVHSQAAQRLALALPTPGDFSEVLLALGRAAAADMQPDPERRSLFEQPENFDSSLYSNGLNEDSAREHYLLHANNVGLLKRALAGFHPRLFMDLSPNFDRSLRLDPLTQYLQAGKPPGPWQHPVLRLKAGATAWPPESKTALHGHFFYTDHISDFMHALAANHSRVDLLLTTGTEAQRAELAEATIGYRHGQVRIEIVPNRGRDIGPFLHVFRQVHDEYDIIGHLHGKRSLHTLEQDAQLGDRWRNFLFQHLLGADAAAVDVILAAFAADPLLGIVFPEDPHVIGWDRDLPLAQRLAAQMGFRQELPPHLDFPVGTMFWARSAALKPLLKLTLGWGDYPAEPLPIDGTILHALERLLPSVAREAGYGFATTYFPGLAR
jgi:nitroreductase